MGVLRFTRIGFPHLYFTCHFVACFGVLCGLLLLPGLLTRLVSIALLIVITTAIATTRIPELFCTTQRFLVHGERRVHRVRPVLPPRVSHLTGRWEFGPLMRQLPNDTRTDE
jgi:hypothetical protein